MRGARFPVSCSWAPGATSRQVLQPRRDILSQFRLGLGVGANRPFSGTSGLNRSTNRIRSHAELLFPCLARDNGLRPALPQCRVLDQVRYLSRTPRRLEPKPPTTRPQEIPKTTSNDRTEENEEPDKGFELSEKAVQATQINLNAKLTKEGGGSKKAGFGEITRLLKIARPEAKSLMLAIVCLLISSSISMSVPFAIGKVIDAATKDTGETSNVLFGLSLPTFYSVLGGILVVGAAANFGRVTTLRIVGERVISRLRSKLFRQTFFQDAEFFDANRVGDLISRLSTDTLIVVKSITQNLSDGLRSLVSGVAGFSLMAYVSIKLSSVLALLLPPIGLSAFFYGRAMRQLSRKIQKNLGTLTKISEERLGNVRTSQSFAGEILEVHRYNTQIRNIFQLGKREALISASFFSSVSAILHYFTRFCQQLLTILSQLSDFTHG